MSAKLLYSLARPLLFSLDPEAAHHLTMPLLQRAAQAGLTRPMARPLPDKRNVMGIDFPNPVGLAAGLDKDGAYIDGLAALGFGFIEIGTVTPLPQPGNPTPRMFRLPRAGAIINRMGFNNGGVDAFVANVQASSFYRDRKGVLGLNIGKNASTPIEIGTVTPLPQPGNPTPRMFRLPQAGAIINRMGFNNGGVDAFVANVQASSFYRDRKGVLGLNIGKNASTPIERAVDDYLICLDKVYPFANYVTVNISSPNTSNLRQLQDAAALDALLMQLKDRQQRLADRHVRYVPIALKIAPDLDAGQIRVIADALLRHRMDGVIATNTTIARDAVQGMAHAQEAGGLSGAPVAAASTAVIRALKTHLGDALPIIGVGGILSAADAREKIEAGASLVQLYTGLIYRGPALVRECAAALRQPR